MGALNRDEVEAASGFPQKIITIEKLGNRRNAEILIRGVSLGHPTLKAYINAPVDRPVEAAVPPDPPDLGKGLSDTERIAARTSYELIRRAQQKRYAEPTTDEKESRTLAGVVILGWLNPDGTPMFGFGDVEWLRAEYGWNTISRIAYEILELSDPADEDAPAGEDPIETGKGTSGGTPGPGSSTA